MIRYILITASLIAVSGCDRYDPTDVISQSRQRSYMIDGTGHTVATSCRYAPGAGYSTMPSGCTRDTILAKQAARPHHLTRPHPPGNPLAGPIGRAADEYLAATSGGGTGTKRRVRQGVLKPVGGQGEDAGGQ